MKEQIIMIGGGRSYKDRESKIGFYKDFFDIDTAPYGKSWKDWLSWSLEDKYEFINFAKPGSDNADYEIWKIVFDKYLSKVTSVNPIFITHSLGTIFILKYLIENGFKSKIKQLHLVAPVVSQDFQPVNDVEDTGTFTFDITKINQIKGICDEVHLWHSTDDDVCLYKNAEYIKEQLPESTLHTFSDRGHFSQSTFLELFDILRR
jgi:predicted alpha/beta hydrolase family esterase